MKVPYKVPKIKHDFALYRRDLENSLQASLKSHPSPQHTFFKVTYPLFVLLESLSNSDYFVDPSQQILLNEYLEQGDKKNIAKIARKLMNKDEQSQFIKRGVLKNQFTPYLKELYSDTLLLLNNYYLNHYRGCYITLRCLLEDLYRHLYYKDHPQEFWAMMTDFDEHSLSLSPRFFREYLPRTSFLQPLSRMTHQFKPIKGDEDKNIFQWNDELYSKTSSYVHASKLAYMSRFSSNAEFAFNPDESEQFTKTAVNVITLSVVFLILAHFEYVLKFNDYETSLILETFEPKVKHNFRQFVNI
ncbi:hypothetical protein PN36_28380 [Candidatus Thiomargarita nelsonii]|uniref:Uncharacterized protein n=1 Tax=Candidatus Thiomargarita nelsonii TaxID=1003181 RepID=A0A0A6P209_9GAMM|nr:hypothetical protein PN36_28380 [Candidatus Thiomargarita nelsonii]